MDFLKRPDLPPYFKGKSVAIVGSGPGVLDNAPGFVDSHSVVVRVNNYRIIPPATGLRTDVHYSFYGTSIRKTREELQRDGVRLCMCKLPNSKPLQSEWHERRRKPEGVDYRYIYRNRAAFWFTATYVPNDEHFLDKFRLLGNHQPTTGFAAILDVLDCEPASVYLTGFDFFSSGVHNVNEPWVRKNPDDPIKHVPDLERDWLAQNLGAHEITTDAALARALVG